MSGIACVLLAAGGSRRFGDDSKLTADLGGRPALDYAAEAAARVAAAHRLAVVRPGDAAAGAILTQRGFTLIENPRWVEGMGTSIAAGAARADALGADAVLVCLGDAPLVTAETLGRLLDAFADGGIAVAKDARRRGCPTLFARAHFPALKALGGDEGGRSVLAAHPKAVVEIATTRPDELDDIDTPEAIAEMERRLAG